jgi:hypothetical protein
MPDRVINENHLIEIEPIDLLRHFRSHDPLIPPSQVTNSSRDDGGNPCQIIGQGTRGGESWGKNAILYHHQSRTCGRSPRKERGPAEVVAVDAEDLEDRAREDD